MPKLKGLVLVSVMVISALLFSWLTQVSNSSAIPPAKLGPWGIDSLAIVSGVLIGTVVRRSLKRGKPSVQKMAAGGLILITLVAVTFLPGSVHSTWRVVLIPAAELLIVLWVAIGSVALS